MKSHKPAYLFAINPIKLAFLLQAYCYQNPEDGAAALEQLNTIAHVGWEIKPYSVEEVSLEGSMDQQKHAEFNNSFMELPASVAGVLLQCINFHEVCANMDFNGINWDDDVQLKLFMRLANDLQDHYQYIPDQPLYGEAPLFHCFQEIARHVETDAGFSSTVDPYDAIRVGMRDFWMKVADIAGTFIYEQTSAYHAVRAAVGLPTASPVPAPSESMLG